METNLNKMEANLEEKDKIKHIKISILRSVMKGNH